MRKNRSPLFSCLLMLILCASIVVGSTYAQFTDNVEVNGNIISTGRLKAGMLWTESLTPAEGGEVAWQDAANATIFDYPYWEPGFTDVKYIRLDNTGSLAFQYKLSVVPAQALTGPANLMDVIDVYYGEVTEGTVITRDNYATLTRVGTLSEIATVDKAELQGILLPQKTTAKVTLPAGAKAKTGSVTGCIVLHMQETAGNEYQNLSAGEGFNLQLYATQYTWEEDSFDNSYDEGAKLPVLTAPTNVTMPVKVDANGLVAEAVHFTSPTGVTATVPVGAKVQSGVTELTLVVELMSRSAADVNLSASDELASYNVKVVGLATDNTVPVLINLGKVLPEGLNLGNYDLYHVENGKTATMTLVASLGDPATPNTFTYDPVDGKVSVAMATFSEVAVVADSENAWNGTVATSFASGSGTEADPYIIANADQLAYMGDRVSNDNANYGGKHYKLIADVNIGGVENYSTNGRNVLFYPIGYNKVGGTTADKGNWYTYGGSFKGVFDGNGHTISGIYQNTWAMVGDYSGTYYNAAMGLFGYVNGGTVKNLTIDNFYSEGEFAPTGCVAAYAAGGATFENIAITNSHPQTYNTGVSGIVGWDEGKESNFTFKNITIDSSNTISALWGSWDVAAAGLLGYLGPNSKADLDNCHVSATIDVYNDVCGNYQYYWYRYCGMLIGTVDKRLDNGKGALDLSNVTATNCTVNFGDRHEYYYCEFVENSKASYTHDYQFSRVSNDDIVGKGESATCQNHNHEEHGYEKVNENSVLVEDKQAVYLPFYQLFGGYGWGVDGADLSNYANMGVKVDTADTPSIEDSDLIDSIEKFVTKFVNEDKFLYRIGNANAVSVGSLFEAADNVSCTYCDSVSDENKTAHEGLHKISVSGVQVSVQSLADNANVSGEFTANTSDWTQGTIQFSGTGPVKVTIQDYQYCKPTVLYLEVVDAVNVTSTTSATANNVVLLNDVSGSFSVSGGFSLYGNGFTVTLPTTVQSKYTAGYVGYVTMSGGNLDNVRIEGPVYPEMYIYREQAKDSSDETKVNYFYNSILINGGNNTISNSYISGSRSAVCIRGGNNVVIENTTLFGGAYANMHIAGASSVTLRDLTTVQVDVADSYGKGKTAHGLGIAVDSAVVDIYIEGELSQYNWLNKSQWDSIVPSNYQSMFPKFFTDSTFSTYWHYLNGGTAPYVNLAMIFACNWDTSKIHDNRTTVDYATCDATIAGVAGGVYSKVNTGGGNTIADADLNDPGYASPGFNPVAPMLNFDNTPNNDVDDENDAADTYCVYDEESGTLKIGVSGDSKKLDLSNVTVTKNGTVLAHTVYLNGTQISGNSVTIKSADGTKQIITIKATSDDAGYDEVGNPIEGSIEYIWYVSVEMAVLAYPAPVWNMGGNYQFDKTNLYYVYYSTSQGYGEAVPIYEGIKVNYYNKSGTLVNLDLSGTTTHPTGSANANANAFTYTLDDGSILMMKFSSGWKSGATTHQFTTYDNKVYIYPQSLDNDNYVRAKTTNQDFNVQIIYNFTDPNGQSTGNQTMQWYNAAASNGSVSTVQWKKFDSTNGKSACVTPDTLVTLADGSKKEIQYVTYEDQLLVWDFYKGEYAVAPASIISNHGMRASSVIALEFADGTVVKVVDEHAFIDLTLNDMVVINAKNAASFVGHSFAKRDGDGYQAVELVNCTVTEELVEAWGILTANHYNCLTEDMVSVAGNSDELASIDYFEFGVDMKYDADAMQADIEQYGVYSYEEFAELVTPEQFEALGIKYMKISVGKEKTTYDYILHMINTYCK